MLKQNGDISGAREAFEAASAIDKNNIANNLELGILLYEAGEYEAAGAALNKLLLHQMNIKDKNTKVKIFYYLGMYRMKTNEPKRAKDMFTRALSVDPNHAPTKEALASLG
jgi:Tfp pilus assembly protein PilF